MAKFTKIPLTSSYGSTSKINQNLDNIETAFNNTLSRDGSNPNSMSASIDMNSNRLINLAAGVNASDAARIQDVQDSISGLQNASTVPFTPTGDISSNTVQGALEELDSEKAKLAGNSTQDFDGGTITATTGFVGDLTGDVTGDVIGNASTADALSYTLPKLYAYRGSSIQTVTSGVWTKVQCQVATLDNTTAYDTVTNFRFTPQRAGYYAVSWRVLTQSNTDTTTVFQSGIYKNGSPYCYGGSMVTTANPVTSGGSAGASIVYLNGTTDYIELWVIITATNPSVYFGEGVTYWTAHYLL